MPNVTEAVPPRGRSGPRIGLLGGSFNPAHDGHRHISLMALKTLRLDRVWWLVSPQNPLKPAAGMAEFDARLALARDVARDPRIHASDIERRLGTRYTADTLGALTRRYPRHAFVWIMGADNLAEIGRWKRWTEIFELVPVAVFDRPSYANAALAGAAARRFARYRVNLARAGTLAGLAPPAWVFAYGKLHPQSATRIRSRRGERETAAEELQRKS